MISIKWGAHSVGRHYFVQGFPENMKVWAALKTYGKGFCKKWGKRGGGKGAFVLWGRRKESMRARIYAQQAGKTDRLRRKQLEKGLDSLSRAQFVPCEQEEKRGGRGAHIIGEEEKEEKNRKKILSDAVKEKPWAIGKEGEGKGKGPPVELTSPTSVKPLWLSPQEGKECTRRAGMTKPRTEPNGRGKKSEQETKQ